MVVAKKPVVINVDPDEIEKPPIAAKEDERENEKEKETPKETEGCGVVALFVPAAHQTQRGAEGGGFVVVWWCSSRKWRGSSVRVVSVSWGGVNGDSRETVI
ncbi:hypothetical protein HAX54_043736 [Datura stramonium]|uniref:Uncharacterized protein n=1 Tax=Datura stramonium TaxID=4076 RepID=A0ABS8SNX4_DATST|nr:hypothetical protein [Datura stramonium]